MTKQQQLTAKMAKLFSMAMKILEDNADMLRLSEDGLNSIRHLGQMSYVLALTNIVNFFAVTYSCLSEFLLTVSIDDDELPEFVICQQVKGWLQKYMIASLPAPMRHIRLTENGVIDTPRVTCKTCRVDEGIGIRCPSCGD